MGSQAEHEPLTSDEKVRTRLEIDGKPMVADVQIGGQRILVSDLVPDDGKFLYGIDVGAIKGKTAGGEMTITVGPLTYWKLLHGGRSPFWSRHTVGEHERERYNRRRKRT